VVVEFDGGKAEATLDGMAAAILGYRHAMSQPGTA
jgi:hypothetical protein